MAELRVRPTRWGEDEESLIVTLRDITDRKQAEEQARRLATEQVARSEAEAAARKFRFLSDASRTLDSTLDPQEALDRLARLVVPELADWCVVDLVEEDGRVRRVGHAHRDPQKAALVAELRDRYPPSRESPHPAAEVLRTGRPYLRPTVGEEDFQGRTVDEGHAELLRELGLDSVLVAPLVARGDMVGMISFARTDPHRKFGAEDLDFVEELTRQAALSVDNARLYQQAEEASRTKSDFLAVMSHELRTPLNAIVGYTQLLEAGTSGPVTDRQVEHLGRISHCSRHLLHLVEEILSFARMETGRERVRPERVDVVELARDVGELIRPMAGEAGLDFRLDLPDGSVEVVTDPVKVRQILLNLLGNAVKFTDEGSVSLRVREDPAGGAALSVVDTGVGIPPDKQRGIFEAFWQVEQSTKRTAGGTGLGLTVAAGLCELLGGRIELDSEPGKGSTFTVRLPAEVGPPGTEASEPR